MTDLRPQRPPPSAPEPPPVPTPPAEPDAEVEPSPPVHRERRHRLVGWRSRDVLRASTLVLAVYFGAKLLWIANPLLLTAFLGILFGLAVEAGVDRLERFRIPRGVGAALIVLSFFGMLVAFGMAMAPTLRTQGAELRRKLPEAIDRVEDWANSRRGLLGMVLGGARTEAATDSAETSRSDSPRAADTIPPARPLDTSAARPTRDTTVAAVPTTQRPDSAAAPGDQATIEGQAPATLRERIGAQLSGATRYLFPFLSSTISAFAGLLLIIFLSIYIAADPELYRRGLMHLFPHRARDRAGEVLSAMATVLRRWLVTQLIAMATIGTVTTIVLLILDVKAAFALGVIAGFLEFIPTIGPILSAVPAIAMGFLDSPEKALYVTIAYVGIQFAENHLLIPLLMKGGVDLPPAVTILSQALMALIFGFLGLMVAVPLVAAGMVAVKMLYVEGVVGDDVTVVSTQPEEEPDPDG